MNKKNMFYIVGAVVIAICIQNYGKSIKIIL